MEKRLQKVRDALGGQEPPRGRIAFADLASWPDDARAAFLAANLVRTWQGETTSGQPPTFWEAV